MAKALCVFAHEEDSGTALPTNSKAWFFCIHNCLAGFQLLNDGGRDSKLAKFDRHGAPVLVSSAKLVPMHVRSDKG